MKREKPIRHYVRNYTKHTESGKKVKVSNYWRGSGKHLTHSSPIAKEVSKRGRFMNLPEAVEYYHYVENSLHGGLDVGKFAEPVNLKLIKVRADQLDSYTSNRPDFEDSVQFHIDEIRNGKTITPILIHKLPSGRYQILDGNARVEAYRRLGITSYPAVENILAAIGSAIGAVAAGAIEGVGGVVGGVVKGTAAGFGRVVRGATEGVAKARAAYSEGAKEREEIKAKQAEAEQIKQQYIQDMVLRAQQHDPMALAYISKYHPDLLTQENVGSEQELIEYK